MKGILAVLALVVLAGCIGGSEKPTATPVPTATPTPLPTVTPTPTPTATPLPENDACYVETDRSLQNAIAIQQCFINKSDYVGCTYSLLKHAQAAEKEEATLSHGWAMRLYSKAIDCAKGAEKLPNADLLPAKMSATIANYFDCYQSDSVCWATTDDIAQIVNALEKVRGEFS